MLQLVCHLWHAPLMRCFMAASSEMWSRVSSEEFLFFTSWCNLISHTHRLPSFFSSLTLLQRSSRTCSAEPGSSTFHTPLSLHRVSMDSSQLVPVYVGTLLKGHFSNRTSPQQRPVELSACEMIAELPMVEQSSLFTGFGLGKWWPAQFLSPIIVFTISTFLFFFFTPPQSFILLTSIQGQMAQNHRPPLWLLFLILWISYFCFDAEPFMFSAWLVSLTKIKVLGWDISQDTC